MTWTDNMSQCAESKKIVWEVAPYLKGRGVDLGAGDFKVLPHVISVDNQHHAQFGFSIKPDVKVDTCEDMSIFSSQSMDFVYSSHLLEHIQNYEKALTEWWRLVKVGGYLILYLPHADFYPKKGTYGANPDHKHDFLPEDIIKAMSNVQGMPYDLLECQERSDGDEYSMLLVFKKINGKKDAFSFRNPKPEKTACLVRYGAYGDMMQAASVIAGLKDQGYHVTVMASPPGSDVIEHDPNVDKFILFDKDQVPNGDLGNFWDYQKKKYDKFVNLSETVEGTLLAMKGRANAGWSPLVRHKNMNQNYLEFQHDVAGVPHKPNIKFYATPSEKEWAKRTRSKMGKFVILWSLAGSAVHKTWPHLDNVVAACMVEHKDIDVVMCGGFESQILETGWEKEKRVHLTSGKWSIRQTLAFLEEADLVIGPETGVLNAAACMDVPKIVFLSHSSVENLTRDWKNTTSLFSKGTRCPGRDSDEVTACHMLHYGWELCEQDERVGTARCQVEIPARDVWLEIDRVYKESVKSEVAA